MPQPDRLESDPTGKARDDFKKITRRLTARREQRLYDGGIDTYKKLARSAPLDVAQAAGVSEDIANDWIGRARELARLRTEPQEPREPPEPRQARAFFTLELIIRSDNSVRETRIVHVDTKTDGHWQGWNADELRAFVERWVSLPAAPHRTDTPDLQPPPSLPSQPPATVPSTPPGHPSAAPSAGLPPSFLRIEGLTPIRDSESGHLGRRDEKTVVRLTMRVNPTDEYRTGTLDYTAKIEARVWGGDERVLLGNESGVIPVDDRRHSVELTGPALRPEIYRLTVTVVLYPPDHAAGAQPLHTESASGGLMGVADAPAEGAPAEAAHSGGAAAEIEKGKQLLDSGVITQAEFEALKAKALA